ncbi:uncharacterized protein [Henckelia pumila]|uniref:uncharacterized protein n=1 Tax=Henckelia pumila TaxID=405737 RepID=UPI003C6DCBE7
MTSSTRSNNNDLPYEIPPTRFKNVESEEVDLNFLERDPGLLRNGKACALLAHAGEDNVSSIHRNVEKAHIHVVRLLALQEIPFRGHDEKSSSFNRGNFLEFLDMLTMYSDDLSKEMPYFDEEVRFVPVRSIVHTRGMERVHERSKANAIYSVLAHYNLYVQNIRGQGYDGASNMRGKFNGLQALIVKDCKSSYYVHCFAHRLQLALVAASKNVTHIHQFFDNLIFIVNIVGSSCKRNDELKNDHADDIVYLIVIDELEIGCGLNQKGTLQRAAAMRWSSHLRSLAGLIKMFSATCTIFLNVMADGLPSQ